MEVQPEAPLADVKERQQLQYPEGGIVTRTQRSSTRFGGEEEHGHLGEFRTDPIGLMKRLRDECGDVGWFQLADKKVILLTGAEANEFFFRSSDEDLDQAEAYPFMTRSSARVWCSTPSPERRAEMLHNTALRGEHMKGTPPPSSAKSAR